MSLDLQCGQVTPVFHLVFSKIEKAFSSSEMTERSSKELIVIWSPLSFISTNILSLE